MYKISLINSNKLIESYIFIKIKSMIASNLNLLPSALPSALTTISSFMRKYKIEC